VKRNNPAGYSPASGAPLIGLWALSRREVLRYLIVAPQTLLPPIVTSFLFLFIFGVSVGQNVEVGAHASSYAAFIVPGLIAMQLISGSFENTSSSLFIARWHNHIQELLLSPLSYFEMVLGLLAGGVSRGMLNALGVWLISLIFIPAAVAHPLSLLYFAVTLTVTFSCLGMMAALWANNFGMLSIWSTYVVTPLVFLGGVFTPVDMLPARVQPVVQWNPLHYLVSGVRYSVTGQAEASPVLCVVLSGAAAVGTLLYTAHLFKIGYKLRS
jgi:ABC-2 type transport system permease protein